MIRKIIIETIPHEAQRYPTIGDYLLEDNGRTMHIWVSDTENWKHLPLVGIHELIEFCLTLDRGISEEEISDFDKAFEAMRQPGNEDEPGDDPLAPYGKEHRFAENLERLFAAELGVNWAQYDKDLCAIWLGTSAKK